MRPLDSTSAESTRDAALVGGVAVAWTAAFALAFAVPSEHPTVLPIGPASGVLLAALVLVPTRLWRPLMLTVALVSLLVDLAVRDLGLVESTGYSLAVALEAYGCAWLVRRSAGDRPVFHRVRDVMALIAGALVVNAITATIAAASATAAAPGSFFVAWRMRYVADGLGILVVAPTITAWVQWREGLGNARAWPVLETATFAVLWIIAIFLGLHPPQGIALRPYMGIALLGWPALRLPMAVAPTAVLVLGWITLSETLARPGMVIVPGLPQDSTFLWIQVFVAFASAISLLMAALRREHRDALAAAQREATAARSEHARVRSLLDTSTDGIHIIDEQGKLVMCGASFRRMLGYAEDESMPLTVHDWDCGLDPAQLVPFIAELMIEAKTFETRHRRKDGTEFEVEINARGVTLDGARLLFASSRDISERRRAEASLRSSEERFRRLANAAPVMMWLLSDTGERLFANERWHEFVGEDRRGASPKRWPDAIHPDDLEAVLSRLRVGLASGDPVGVQFRARRHDGAYRWLLAQGVMSREHPGSDGVFIASAFDVTEAREAEDRLRESESDLRAAEQMASFGHWTWDLAKGIVRCSDGLLAIWGLPREGAWDDPRAFFHGMVHPEDTAAAEAAWSSMIDGGTATPMEFRIIRQDGDVRTVRSIRGSVVRDAAGAMCQVSGVMQDVTDQKAVEEALRASEIRWQFAVDGTGDGLWDWDVERGRVYFSPQWKAMLGYGIDEVGESLEEWSSRVHPDDFAETMRLVQQHLRGASPLYTSEHRVRCKDGTWLWVHDRGIVLRRDAAGHALRMVGTHRDITARKRSEAALVESEGRFRALSDSAPVLVWVTDASNRTVSFNRQWVEFTGLDVPDLAELWVALMHPDDYSRCRARYDEALAAGAPYEMEYRLRRRDGEYRWILERALPRFDSENAYLGYVGAGVDITDQVELRSALSDARAAADSASRAKTEFLANISHEIRTPLNGVMGHVQLLGETSLTADQRVNLNAISQSANNLLTIVNDVLDLSKIEAGRVVLAPQAFNVVACLTGVVGLMRPRATSKGLTISLEVQEQVPPILEGDELRIRQILQNLISNAVKFTLKGSVTVTASAVRHREGVVLLTVSVADTGVGIAPDAMERIFEPFVQADSSITRRFGGTGLGLSIARRLAVQMSGEITARSLEGTGSVFQLLLPLPVSTRRPASPIHREPQ